MEEFIENFNEFREWLYEKQLNSGTPESRKLMDQVIQKFESLDLNEAF